MRFADCDVEFPGQEWLWEQALNRAVNGKPGQAALRDLEAALVALPEKRLIGGRLARGGEVCVVGALVVARRVAAGEDRDAVLADLEAKVSGEDGWVDSWEAEEATLAQAKRVGLRTSLACMLSYENDELYQATPEQRYSTLLAYVRSLILPAEQTA